MLFTCNCSIRHRLDRAYGGGNFPCPNMTKCGKKYRNLNGLSYHLATSTCARESAQSSQRTSLSGPVQQNIMAADRDFLQMVRRCEDDVECLIGFRSTLQRWPREWFTSVNGPAVSRECLELLFDSTIYSGFSTRGELITHVGQAHIGSRQDFM